MSGQERPLRAEPSIATPSRESFRHAFAQALKSCVVLAVVLSLLAWLGWLDRTFYALGLGGLLLLFAVGAIDHVLSSLREENRGDSTSDVAKQLGLAHHPTLTTSGLEGCSEHVWYRSQLLGQKEGARTISNVLTGTVGGLETAVFDYELVTHEHDSTGTREASRRYTVFLFRCHEIDFPSFILRPNNFWQRMERELSNFFWKHFVRDKQGARSLSEYQWKLLGTSISDIDLVEQPGLSRRYRLLAVDGEDKDRVAKCFSGPVVSCLAEVSGLVVEGLRDFLVVYPAAGLRAKYVKSKAIPALLNDAQRIAAAFLTARA